MPESNSRYTCLLMKTGNDRFNPFPKVILLYEIHTSPYLTLGKERDEKNKTIFQSLVT